MKTPKLKTPSFNIDKKPSHVKSEVNTYAQAAHNGLDLIIQSMQSGQSYGGEDWTICQDTRRVFRVTYCEVADPTNTTPCKHCNGTGLQTAHNDPRLN